MRRRLQELGAAFVAGEAGCESVGNPVPFTPILEDVHIPFRYFEGLLDGLGDLTAAIGVDAQPIDDQLQRGRVAGVRLVEIAHLTVDPGPNVAGFHELREHLAAVLFLEEDRGEDDDLFPFE